MPDWSSVKLFLSRRLVAGRLPLNPLRNTGRHLTETVWPVLFVVVFPWPNHFDDQRGKSLLIKIQKPKLIMKKTSCRIEFSRYRVRTTHTVGLAPWIDAAAGLRSFLNAAHFSNRVQVIGRTNGKCQMIQSRLHTHICFLVFLSPLTAGAGLNWQYQWLVRFVGHSIDALLTKSISVVKNMSVMASEPTRWWFVGWKRKTGSHSSRFGYLFSRKNFNRLRLIIVCRRARAI